jgi:hypothetical protein
MFESQNLVVNPNNGCVHRKTCGSVNYLTMFTLPAKLFHTIGDQRDYSTERGWVACRTCDPFAARLVRGQSHE